VEIGEVILHPRLALHITQTAAAQHFSVWSTAISRIEKGSPGEHALTKRYRAWLDEQGIISA
jgi:transcriptional regulator with XRE-family HTH domain